VASSSANILYTLSAQLDGSAATAFAQFEQQGQRAGQRVSQAVGQVGAAANQSSDKLRAAAAAARLFEGGIGGVASRLTGLNELLRTAGGLIGGSLGIAAGAVSFISYASTIQSAEARLRALSGSTADYNVAQSATIRIAQESRSNLVETIKLYSGLEIAAKRAGLSQSQVGTVVQAAQTAAQVQGLNPQESNAAQLELRHAFDANFQGVGQQLRQLGKESPLIVEEIVTGLKKLGVLKFDGTVESLRHLAKEGKLNSALVAEALSVTLDDLKAKLDAGGVTISQATNLIATSFAKLTLAFEKSTGTLNGVGTGIAFVASHMTELGGVLVVVGTAYAASFAAPLILSIPSIISTGASVARLVLGFNGLGPALIAGGLGLSKFSTALTTLLTPTNLVTIAFTAAAAAIYYFSTRETILEESARRMGVSQDELRAKALGAAAAIDKTSTAINEQGRLTAVKDRDDQGKTALTARSSVGLYLSSARDQALATGRPEVASQIGSLIDGYGKLKINADGVVAALKKLDLPTNTYRNIVGAAAASKEAAVSYVDLAGKVANFGKTTVSSLGGATEATNIFTSAQLRTHAALNTITAATDARVAAQRREAAQLADLDAKYHVTKGEPTVDPSGGSNDATLQQRYEDERTQIIQTRDAAIEGIKTVADQKRKADKADRDAKAAQRKTDSEAAAETKKKNNEQATALADIASFQQKYADETTAQNRLAKEQRKQFTDLLVLGMNNGDSFGVYLRNAAQAAGSLTKPLREANAQAQLLAATDKLDLAGNADAAAVLQRAVKLRREGTALADIDLGLINQQVIAEGERSTALAHQNDLIGVYARTSGEIQGAFRDLFAGNGIGNFGRSLQTTLRNSLADSLSIKIFGNAQQDAQDRMIGATGANTDALLRVRDALTGYDATLRNPSTLGDAFSQGLTDSVAKIASSPLSGAANDNLGIPNVANDNVAASQAGRLLGGGGAALGGILGIFALSNSKLSSSTSLLASSLDGGGSGTSNSNIPKGAGANFADNLSRQFGQLGDFFDKKLGNGTTTGNTQDAGSGALSKAGSSIGTKAGEALVGYQEGAQVTGLLQSLGVGKANTGSKVGGYLGAAAGEAIGGPAGAAIGQVLGSLVGSLFGGVTARAFTQLSVDAYGTAIAGAQRSRGDKAKENLGSSSQEASAFTTALGSLASTFGASLKASSQLGEIGVYNGQFGFHRQFGDGGGDVQTFATAAEAVAAAIKNAINVGAVEGLREGTKRLLTAAGEFSAQTNKAQKFEAVFTDLKAATDPVGSAIDTVNRKFNDLRRIFDEAGASTSDYASLQQLYDLQRADALKAAESKTVSVLKDYLTSLQTSSSIGLSARDRESAALATFDPLAADVTAGKKVDQTAFKTAADALLSVDRELFGSTSDYFVTLARITGLTQKAIDNATSGTSSTATTDSVLSLAPASTASNDNFSTLNDSIVSVGSVTNGWLAQIAANIGGNQGSSPTGYVFGDAKVANF
jgi:hypothetical protein